MKKSLFFLFSIYFFSLTAQTSYIINVGGTSNTFAPANLTINVGDTVIWNNIGGFHNVNSTQATYPSNPEGFGNSVSSSAWSFQWGFTIAGTYDYQCDPHIPGMVGVVIVNSPPPALTYVPDSAFEAFLENNGMGNNIPNDSNVFTSAIDTVTNLNVSNRQIADLTGIEDFTFLDTLNCGDNQLTSLDVSSNTALTVLECWFNQLTSLDVSANTALTYLGCGANNLTSLDVRNGNNTNFIVFYTIANPNLNCIDVDDPVYSTANWTVANGNINIDPQHYFSTNCATGPLSPAENLFFSEYAEGSSYNKYFEVYNPTADTVDLTNYAYPMVNNSPGNGPGIYESWRNFDSGSVILPHDVYVVAHSSADSAILMEADMIVTGTTSLSNGNDGMALVYGIEPPNPASADSGGYVILDWIGTWDGDYTNNPGGSNDGWNVAGVAVATANHTLVRKCPISKGDTSWINATGTDPVNTQWIVMGNNDWSDIGSHTTCVCDSSTNSYTSIFDTICNGLSITVGNSTYDSTGVYSDTLLAFNGCDSIITTNLTVLSASASSVINDITICDGNSVMVDTNVYNQTGTYIDTLVNTVGCDSIITTNLTVQTPTYQNFTICDGDSVLVGNSVYYNSGSYMDTLVSSISCDSIIHTNLTVYSQFASVFGGADSASTPGAYSNYNGHLNLNCIVPSKLISALVYAGDTNAITFELRDNTGNVLDDTTITVQLGEQRIYFDFNIPVGSALQLGVSSGNTQLFRSNSGTNYPYNIGSVTITSSNNNNTQQYYYFYYNLEIQQTTQPTTYSICDGDSIHVGNSVYYTSGYYVDSLTSVSSCDSIVYTNLTVSPNVSYINNQTICSGETYLIGGNVYDSAGIYIDSLNTPYGCDSVVTTNLTVLTISGGIGANSQTICIGDSLSVGNSIYSTAGIYTDTLVSSNGCDSLLITTLNIVSANYSSTINGGILDTTIGGGGFFSGSQYLELSCYESSMLVSTVVYSQDTSLTTFEVRDDNGNVLKDTIVNLIPGSQRIYFNYEMSAGADYELGVNGASDNLFRTNSGVNYPYNFASAAAVTSSSAGGSYYYFFYDIEIIPHHYQYNKQYICDGDSIQVGWHTYDTTGAYVDTFVNTSIWGCDSVVYTVLDFYDSPALTINTVRICNGESITINGNVYAATGVYTDTYTVFNGCDSIVETHLTIDSAVTAQISQNGVNIEANINGGTSPYSYIWSSGETSQSIAPLANGSYWVIATDTNGCFSDTVFYMVTFIPSGVDDILNSDINIYPNPTDGLIHINSDLKIEKIELFSVEGKLLKSTTELFILLDVKGIYFIKIITEQGNIMKRVVVN